MGRALVLMSFGLNLLIIISVGIRHDRLSALNIPPIWVWSTIGIMICLLSMLFRRKTLPLGIKGGGNGRVGQNLIERKNGKKYKLKYADQTIMNKGDAFILSTPGGGAYGKKKD